MKKTIETSTQTDFIQLKGKIVEYSLYHDIKNLQGNDKCCDCGSKTDVSWISLKFGVVLCIKCSYFHRYGIHSNIQHLSLDNIITDNLLIARAMGNNTLNNVMEATVENAKLVPDSSQDERYEFIRAKYVAKRYVMPTCSNDSDLRNKLEQSVINADLSQLLQVWAEGADLTALLPSSRHGETALHLAVSREMGSTLHIVDFLIQNMPSQGLNKAINILNIPNLAGKNTALHLCAMYDRPECMKLLLRSGADFEITNEQGKTTLAIAKEMGHDACRKLIECAVWRQKGAFDYINTDWNLPHDDGSTDLLDNDIVVEPFEPLTFKADIKTPNKSSSRESITKNVHLNDAQMVPQQDCIDNAIETTQSFDIYMSFCVRQKQECDVCMAKNDQVFI